MIAIKQVWIHIAHRQETRFLLVGGVNTLLGYLLFSLLYLMAGSQLTEIGTVMISYILTLIMAFFLYRRFVFPHIGNNINSHFLKFSLSNTFVFLLNLFFLPITVRVFGWHALYAQATFIVLSSLFSFLLHKYFSFT